MNDIHKVCHKIKIDEKARERILGKRHHVPATLFLVPIACIVCVCLFFGVSRVPRQEEPTDGIVAADVQYEVLGTEKMDDEIIVNKVKDDELTVLMDVSGCKVDATDEGFVERFKAINVVESIAFDRAYAMYGGIVVPMDEELYGYMTYYINPHNAIQGIGLFFSEQVKKMPECYQMPMDMYEPSIIQGTEVYIMEYGTKFEALFTKGTWNYHMKANHLNEGETIDMIRSILAKDIDPVAPVLDAYEGMEIKETVFSKETEEKTPMQLYEEADIVGMVVIQTIDGGCIWKTETCTEGTCQMYHRYKGDEDGAMARFRYIRNGGIVDGTATMHAGDVMVEQGKCYLAFMKRIDDQTVEIFGYQDGFRELKEYVPSFDRRKLMFLDNRNGVFESIADILPGLENYGECFAR